MFELIIKFGLVSVCIVAGVSFLLIYFLAEPHKEITFWGIKFHKKWMPKKKIYWKRVPKNIPKEWESVLLVFKKEDTPRINETHLFQDLLVLSNISELKVREICIDMEKCGLLEYSYNSYILKERAFKLINRLSSV
jgi:hypothetical protein